MTPNDKTDPEEDGPSLAPSDEMAEALREAEESVEERRRTGAGGDPPAGGASSTDKLTIEVLSQELQSLKEEFEARSKELEESKDRYLRLQAEFENFRRRTLKEKQESLQYGQQNLIKDLLAPVDNLERALGHIERSAGGDLQNLLQGLVLVQREFLAALGKHGVRVVDPKGEAFDPAFHEAMGQVASDDVAANRVVQVLQKGYVLKDRMLRPAMVLLAAPPATGSKKTEGPESGSE
ncbi:MAG TPA: nucleotide exchange factor GrpE [Thermoanaerobaculia bacterium]